MASTYTVNIGIEKPGTGDQSGTWGSTTNTNFDIIDQATNGVATVTLAAAGTSGSPLVAWSIISKLVLVVTPHVPD